MNILKQYIFIVLGVLTFTGCATNVESVRNNPSGFVAFEVKQPYMEIYRLVLNMAEMCNPGEVSDPISDPLGFSTEWIVTGKTQNESASISFSSKDKLTGVRYYMLVEIKPINASITRVKTYYKHKPWRESAELVERWVKENSGQCWLK